MLASKEDVIGILHWVVNNLTVSFVLGFLVAGK